MEYYGYYGCCIISLLISTCDDIIAQSMLRITIMLVILIVPNHVLLIDISVLIFVL